MKKFKLAASVLTVLFANSALADGSAVGFGIGPQRLGSEETSAVGMIGGSYHQSQLHKIWKGHALIHTRLELGSGFGIAHSSRSGARLLGVKKDEVFFPYFALEPVNFDFSANTNKERRDYFEWLPSASGGLQFNFSNVCQLLAVARMGGAIGTGTNTRNDGGVRWNYGGGAHLNCRYFDIAADLSRIENNTRLPTDRAQVDLVAKVPRRIVTFGLRGEVLTERDSQKSLFSMPSGNDRNEFRALVVIGGEIPDLGTSESETKVEVRQDTKGSEAQSTQTDSTQ